MSQVPDICSSGACSSIVQFDIGQEDWPGCARLAPDGKFEIVGQANESAARVGFDVNLGGDGRSTIRSFAFEAAPGCTFDPGGGLRMNRTRRTGDVPVHCGGSLRSDCFAYPYAWTVCSVAADGTLRWEIPVPMAETTAAAIAANDPANVTGMVVDATGSTWVAAAFPVSGSNFRYNGALSRIDPAGHVEWTQVLPGANVSIAGTDSLGDAYVVVGNWSDGATVVRTYSPDGTVQSTIPLPGAWAWARGVDFGPGGPSYVASYLPGTNTSTLYLSKIDASGGMEWTVAVGENLLLNAIARDPSGHPWLVGHLYSTTGHEPVFVARLDPAGTIEWFIEFRRARSNTRMVWSSPPMGLGTFGARLKGECRRPDLRAASRGRRRTPPSWP